jgi:hypothetical protein
MYKIELSEVEIDLMRLSLSQQKEWLLSQKGQLGGALMGFSEIDKICSAMEVLSERLQKVLDEESTGKYKRIAYRKGG